VLSRSWTTRPQRPHEPDDAYVFVDRATFEAQAAAGGFLEWAEFLGNLYGTPIPELAPDRDLLLEIDLQGAKQIKARFPESVVILLVPPSPEAQAQRLRARGDDEAAVARRLAKGEEEMAVGAGLADHRVVNQDIDQTLTDVAGILGGHRRSAPASPGADSLGGP
jgi:guanylate kinase